MGGVNLGAAVPHLLGVGGGSGLYQHQHQQLLRPPPPPVAAAVGGYGAKWASASLTTAAALLEMEPDPNPMPVSALLPIPQPAATAAAAADARAPAGSHGVPAPPGQANPSTSWMHMASAISGLDRRGGGEPPPEAIGTGGWGPGGGAAGDGGAGRARGEPATGKANETSKKAKAAAYMRDVMGITGTGALNRSSGSSCSSSSTSDLSGAQPSKALSGAAAAIVEAVLGLPTKQRAEVCLELNRLYPQYAIPPIPSLPATALPTMASLPATLPDGRSQKTCTLCGRVGHNSRSRFCPKRAQG